MSVIPILVSLYLVSNYIFSLNPTIIAVIIVSIVVASLGFHLVKELIDSIIKVTHDASRIAKGDFGHRIELEREDEIGDLTNSLRQLTLRIKENMGELRSYGERTKEINVKIHKRVLVLSGLLQIGELISSGVEFDRTLQLIMEKLAQLEETGCAFLMLLSDDGQELVMRSIFNIDDPLIRKMRLRINEGFLGRIVTQNKAVITDSQTPAQAEMEAFQNKLGVKNLAIFPITLKGKPLGLLAVGNQLDDFVYRKDELELIDVFIKQVAIAAENDLLVRQAEKLAIRDNLTGLYNKQFIRSRLEEEIKRAIIYQRPCSFIIFNIDNFKQYHSLHGEIETENVLRKTALILTESADEIDKVARFGDDEFAMLLPEKNKKLATERAEEIRKKLEFTFSEEIPTKRLTVSGGVSENPIDGVTAEELISHALKSVKVAKTKGKNRIIS
jgi:diguanylate cyclase (GGDEF)-like protein